MTTPAAPARPVLCKDCKTTDRFRDHKGENWHVKHFWDCKQAEVCCQTTSGDSWRYSGRCGRPLKGLTPEGVPVCGIHKNSSWRWIKEDEARRIRNEARAFKLDHVNDLCRQIYELTGLKCRPHTEHYGQGRSYLTDSIVVDPQALLDLIDVED